jgi:hypothetical protein
MRPNALRRAIGAAAVIAASALILGNHLIGVTSASFSGETKNAGSGFAGGWIDVASAGTAVAGGYDMTLNWTTPTTPTHGPVTGQKLTGVDNGTNSDCTSAAYGALATLASATTNTYSDLSRATLATDGDWYCYEIVSTSATVWTGIYNLPAAQLGLAATAVSTANKSGGVANRIEAGDTITITFNQRTNIAASTTAKVCVFTNNIAIGDLHAGTTCGTSAAADGYSVGLLSTTSTISAAVHFTNSTVVRATTGAPWTVGVTLGTASGVTTAPAGATWKFTPATTVLSNQTTHQATACTTTATTCQPTTTTGF